MHTFNLTFEMKGMKRDDKSDDRFITSAFDSGAIEPGIPGKDCICSDKIVND